MSKSGPEYPKNFSLDGDAVTAISQEGYDLLVSHFFGKIKLAGCIQITTEPPSVLTFDTPMAARIASWQLESLARLSDAHLTQEINLLTKMQE